MKTPAAQMISTFISPVRKTLIQGTIAMAVLTSLAACAPKKSGGSAIDTSSIMSDRHLSTSQKSEELALAAEQLVGAHGVIYANDVADLALQIDPKNVRARFWKAALGPVVQSRGLANRIAPLMHNLGKDAEYQSFLVQLQNDTQERKFLMDGPQDIATERDVQEFVAQTTLRMDTFRKTMKALRNQALTIHLNTDLKGAWDPNQERETCEADSSAPGVYSVNCDLSKASSIEINSADFEALELGAAGAQIYTTIYNGWDLSGTIAFAKANPNLPANSDPNAVAQALFANPNFGKMLKPSQFGVIPDLAKDVVIGARYAQAKQAQFCKTGSDSEANRPGHLFEKGFCLKGNSPTDAQFAAFEASLSGTASPVQIAVGSSYSTQMVNLRNLFTKSLRDVRSYFPVQRNQCGYVTSVNDSGFEGTFAPGALNQVLSQIATQDCSAQ